MSQMWIERLREAPSKVARDEILLREFKQIRVNDCFCPCCEWEEEDDPAEARNYAEVEEQMRVLADIAFPSKA